MSDAFNQMLAQGPTPIKFENPVNQMAQIMQLKNAQQTGVVNQMAIDKGQRDIAQKNALNAAYQGNIDPATGKINFSGLGQRLAAEGQGELLPDIQKAEQVFRTGEDTAAKARNDRIVGGLELTQNALSRIDPYSPNAGEQMKSIFSGAHKDPVLGAWLDSNGQTEAATHATVDDAVRKGAMPALYLQSMSSAKSIQDRIAKEGTPQSPVAKMQADLARLPLGSPARAALEAAISKAGQFAPTAEDKPKRQIVVNENGEFVSVDTNTGLDPTGNPVVGRPTAAEEKDKFEKQNKSRRMEVGLLALNELIGTEATDTAPAVPGVLDVATSSGVGTAVDAAAQVFGKETKGRIATGEAEVLADSILKTIDRFEGPQSDRDTLSYQKAAGQLSNPNVGRETKIAAAKRLRGAFEKEAAFLKARDAGKSTPSPAGVKPAAKTEATTFEEGHIIVNPKTGKRAVLQGGAWVPIP